MGDGHVFICHASEDRGRAELVCDSLAEEGIRCWIAPRDVRAGQRYAAAILEAIERCDVFLVVFSAHADSSPHVSNEIESAASNGKPILLVRTDSTDPGANHQIRLFLGSHQWFDASQGELAEHTQRIAADARRLLEGDQAEAPAAPSSRPAPPPEPPPAPVPAPPTAQVPPSRRSIGIEIGATKIRGCVLDIGDGGGEPAPVAQYFEPVRPPASVRTVLEQAKSIVQTIVDENFQDGEPVGIGVAVPGQVDVRAGTLKFGPNLFGARNVPFKPFLSREFPGIPVRVDNEIRCATRCELHLGTGREFEHFVCIFLGTGVGSGTVIDRRIYFGNNFCAGEVGHIKIATSGAPCACGQIGCLETFVKAQAIVARAEAKAIDWESRELATVLNESQEPLDPMRVAAAIDEGDAAAREVAREVAEDLGLGIASYLNLVNPAAVILGGGLMTGFFFHMIDDITGSVEGNALAEVAHTPIVQSAHSDDGISIGAALLFHPDDEWPH
ncbi:MAG TPA: ROK family protein [Solirubrobacterales bacterium]|nr:ROK family protein [Solirubrobacterales bacterium]